MKTDCKDIEIIGDNYLGSYKRTRYACRGVIIQNNQILLSYATKKDFWMLPGGGREEGESEVDCVIRELSEETGYVVIPQKQAVKVIEYYDDVRYVSVYFICKIAEETTPKLTEAEILCGLERRWCSLKETMKIFSENEKYRDVYEEKRGSYLREYKALTKMIEKDEVV